MKTDTHPNYQPVVFQDISSDFSFLTRSTKKDLRVEICSACHPFFTGKQKLVDSAGRVERFRIRYEKKGGEKAGDKTGAPA